MQQVLMAAPIQYTPASYPVPALLPDSIYLECLATLKCISSSYRSLVSYPMYSSIVVSRRHSDMTTAYRYVLLMSCSRCIPGAAHEQLLYSTQVVQTALPVAMHCVQYRSCFPRDELSSELVPTMHRLRLVSYNACLLYTSPSPRDA